MAWKIFKRFWREIIIAILVIAVSISVNTCSKERDTAALLRESADSTKLALREYVTKNGQLVTQINTIELTVKQLRQEADVLGIDNRSLRRQVGSLSGLVGYWKGKAAVRDSFTVVNTDTVYLDNGVSTVGKAFSWENRFIQVNGVTAEDSTTVTYQYAVDFSLMAYRKGKTLFRRGDLVTDIYFSDPNFKVREFKGYVIKEPPKKFYEKNVFWGGLGFAVGFFLKNGL